MFTGNLEWLPNKRKENKIGIKYATQICDECDKLTGVIYSLNVYSNNVILDNFYFRLGAVADWIANNVPKKLLESLQIGNFKRGRHHINKKWNHLFTREEVVFNCCIHCGSIYNILYHKIYRQDTSFEFGNMHETFISLSGENINLPFRLSSGWYYEGKIGS